MVVFNIFCRWTDCLNFHFSFIFWSSDVWFDKCHSRNLFLQWLNVYHTPSPFSNFLNFFIILCAFEALITPFLHKYHCSLQHWPLVHCSVCLIFFCWKYVLIFQKFHFIFESFIRVSMLLTPMSVSMAHSIIIYWTNSILGFKQQQKVSCLAQFLQELMQIQSMRMFFYPIWLTG